MHCKGRSYLYSTVAVLAISFWAVGNACAQGVISLSENIQQEDAADNNAADLALFDDTSVAETASAETTSDALPNPEVDGFKKPLISESEAANINAETVENDPIPLAGPVEQPALNPMAAPNNEPLLGAGRVSEPVAKPLLKPNTDDLADKLIAKTNDTLFSQMSDLERQTTLLSLELRREKIKSEIEAIKAQRRRAEEEEKAFLEEKDRKRKEWENEQARLLLIEEQKIIELEINMEKERQERLVKAYKEYMLEENQKWIKNNEGIYKVLEQVEQERDEVYESLKTKIGALFNAASAQVNAVKEAKARYDRKVEEYQLQISILKARLEAAEAEKRAMKANPFADGENFMEHPDKNRPRLSDEYAILDVRGQGDDLVAKLMNADKKTFNVKVGTILHTGHRVDEITRSYVRGDLDGFKDFIYLSVGNAMDKEPVTAIEDKIRSTTAAKRETASAEAASDSTRARPSRRGRSINTNRGIPSVSSGLMVK